MASLLIIPAALIGLSSFFYQPVKFRLEQVGITRHASSIHNVHGSDPSSVHTIPDAFQCEDLHTLPTSHLIFAACQDPAEPQEHTQWFPPLAIFDQPKSTSGGRLVTIDPKTFAAQTLLLDDFSSPGFVTHGIDVIPDPTDPATSAYIFAISHLPNPAYYDLNTNIPHPNVTSSTPKALSRIELFHHPLNTTHALHIRSITHPLIRTPNDLVATSPRSFYVTNDHHYRSGLLRDAEDILTKPFTGWSDVVYVTFTGDDTANLDDGVTAEVALDGEHNPNGLGRGATLDEIVLNDASGGVMTRLNSTNTKAGRSLSIVDRVSLSHTVDNPTYYASPKKPGYVIAGLLRAVDLAAKSRIYIPKGNGAWDPPIVSFLPRAENGSVLLSERKVLFQDKGDLLRTGTTAVIVDVEGEQRLFVSGVLANAVVAVKVEL
ncbi:MAG: hypothetical protein Q9227_001373 [Pyrenula ochraceoflavens]